VVITGLAYYVLYRVYCHVVLDPLAKTLEGMELTPEEIKQAEEMRDSIFIPFPGTTKEIKPSPYRGTDPEWQEFIKFSKDQALAKIVRGGDRLSWFIEPVLTEIR
jgi:hypothetical protein